MGCQWLCCAVLLALLAASSVLVCNAADETQAPDTCECLLANLKQQQCLQCCAARAAAGEQKVLNIMLYNSNTTSSAVPTHSPLITADRTAVCLHAYACPTLTLNCSALRCFGNRPIVVITGLQLTNAPTDPAGVEPLAMQDAEQQTYKMDPLQQTYTTDSLQQTYTINTCEWLRPWNSSTSCSLPLSKIAARNVLDMWNPYRHNSAMCKVH
jgi:hypothetical protein